MLERSVGFWSNQALEPSLRRSRRGGGCHFRPHGTDALDLYVSFRFPPFNVPNAGRNHKGGSRLKRLNPGGCKPAHCLRKPAFQPNDDVPQCLSQAAL